jgi:hypothetical protein
MHNVCRIVFIEHLILRRLAELFPGDIQTVDQLSVLLIVCCNGLTYLYLLPFNGRDELEVHLASRVTSKSGNG